MKVIKRKKNPQILVGLIIILLSFAFIYPFWHTLAVSFGDKYYSYEPGHPFVENKTLHFGCALARMVRLSAEKS